MAESVDCLFCQIVNGTVPARVRAEDALSMVFDDLVPQAPTHLLVIPKRHLRDIGELAEDAVAALAVLTAIRTTTQRAGLTDFRTVFNTGRLGGQHVFHVHAHVLAGRPLTWPPG